jgi:hypothetical protein
MLISHHTPISAVLRPLVAAYAMPTHKDMWAWEMRTSADKCSKPGCSAAGTKRNQKCKHVRYCGRKHQLAQKAHKSDCKRLSAEEGKGK